MFRGDRALLGDAMDQLEARCGVPTLGVLPYLPGLVLDAEDSLHQLLAALGAAPPAGLGRARRRRHAAAPAVQLHRCRPPADRARRGGPLRGPPLPPGPARPDRAARDQGHGGRPGLAARAAGWPRRCRARRAPGPRHRWCWASAAASRCWAAPSPTPRGPRVCGPDAGLGWLAVATTFDATKTTRLRRACRRRRARWRGYEIHHGRTRSRAGLAALAGAGGRRDRRRRAERRQCRRRGAGHLAARALRVRRLPGQPS